MKRKILQRLHTIFETVLHEIFDKDVDIALDNIRKNGYISSNDADTSNNYWPQFMRGGDQVQLMRDEYFKNLEKLSDEAKIKVGEQQLRELEKSGEMRTPINLISKLLNTDSNKLYNFYDEVRNQVEADKLKSLGGTGYADEWGRQNRGKLAFGAGLGIGGLGGYGLHKFIHR